MADWKQIQARIRKARTGEDAVAKMTDLYQRTRDAMVAFELGKLYEQNGTLPSAIEWYTMAWERFRRRQWKAKAEEALTRLGAPVPEDSGTAEAAEAPRHARTAADEDTSAEAPEPVAVEAGAPSVGGGEAESEAEKSAEVGRKRTRRGRRGGRGRRRRAAAAESTAAPQKAAAPAGLPSAVYAVPEAEEEPAAAAPRGHRQHREEREESRDGRAARHAPTEPQEAHAPRATRSGRARAGDPAMASRAAQLDSQLRRLISSIPHTFAELENAPAGPGVLLLSDSDLATNYYIERCDTLRVALKMIHQGARGRDRGRPVRAELAEHLQVSDAQVKRYLQDHCVVRWIQLDEGAAHLAHYAIALLRPVLNS